MKISKQQFLAAAVASVAVLGGAFAAEGAVLKSFEDATTQGFDSVAGQAATSASTTGATDGTQSLRIDYAAGFQNGTASSAFTPAQLALFQPGELVRLDVTQLSPVAVGNFTQATLRLSYRTTAPGDNFGFASDFTNNVTFGEGEAGTRTASLAVPADFNTANPFAGVFISTNNAATAGTFYVDNLRVGADAAVPEPAALGLLGLGGLALTARRRRA